MMYRIPDFNQEKNKTYQMGKKPRLLYIGSIFENKEWNINRHCHNCCELILIDQGNWHIKIENNEYQCKPGDLIILNKGVVHEESIEPRMPGRNFFLGIDDLQLYNMPKNHLIGKSSCPVFNCRIKNPSVEEYISAMYNEAIVQMDGYEAVLDGFLQLVVLMVKRIADSVSSRRSHDEQTGLADKIKLYIEKNYYKDLSLESIARELYISPYYMAHVFKDGIGLSPISYMIQIRMEHAKEFLEATNKSLKDIAEFVGYNNTTYFSAVFKRLIGVSPSTYRKTKLNG